VVVYAEQLTLITENAPPNSFIEKGQKQFILKKISKSNYLAFSQQTDDAIVAKFQEGFDKINANGIYEQITKKWDNQ